MCDKPISIKTKFLILWFSTYRLFQLICRLWLLWRELCQEDEKTEHMSWLMFSYFSTVFLLRLFGLVCCCHTVSLTIWYRSNQIRFYSCAHHKVPSLTEGNCWLLLHTCTLFTLVYSCTIFVDSMQSTVNRRKSFRFSWAIYDLQNESIHFWVWKWFKK